MFSIPHNSSVFNHASIGITVVNKKGIIIAINPYALSLFGYTKKELIKKPIEILIPERFHDIHRHHREEYSKNPVSRPMGIVMDLYGLKKDGTEFPTEVSLSVYNKGNNTEIIAFISDITIRKNSQAEIFDQNSKLESIVNEKTKKLSETLRKLKWAGKRLEEALAYKNALLFNAGAMIVATDQNGIIKLFNKKAAENLGYSEAEIINKETPLLFHDKKEIEEVRKNIFKNSGILVDKDLDVFLEMARQNYMDENKFTFIRKDGSTFPGSLNISAIKNKNEAVIGYIGIAMDISQRLVAEDNLRKSLEKEIELNQLKSNFVSLASHEFRTPLSTVLSSAYLIENYTTEEDQPKRKRHLDRIISAVGMLTDILNDFLSLGKIEEGKIQVRPSEFNIQEFVQKLSEELKNNLKKNQEILYSHCGKTRVLMDNSLLKHILMNLMSNASKFSSEGGKIEISTYCENGQVSLTVSDNGIGISPEDQKHLMERFFRGANAVNVQGTGLGLHIVAKYAELMNGKVSFTSELNKGSSFTILFNK